MAVKNFNKRKQEGYNKRVSKKVSNISLIVLILFIIQAGLTVIIINKGLFTGISKSSLSSSFSSSIASPSSVSTVSSDIQNSLSNKAKELRKVMNIRYNGYTPDAREILYNTFIEKTASSIEEEFMGHIHKGMEKIDVTEEIKPYINKKKWKIWVSNGVLRKIKSRYYVLTTLAYREGYYKSNTGNKENKEIKINIENKKNKGFKVLEINKEEKGIGDIGGTYNNEKYYFYIDEYALYGKSLFRVTFKNKDNERVNLDVYISDKGDMEVKNIEPVVSYKFTGE